MTNSNNLDPIDRAITVVELILYSFLATEAAHRLIKPHLEKVYYSMEAGSINNPDNDPITSANDPDLKDQDTDAEDKSPVDPGDAAGEKAGAEGSGQAIP